MVYRWKEGNWARGSAQEVGEFLEKTRIQNNGILTPELVVDAAKSKKSVIHAYFEWDDSEAAQAWRKQQARQLISSVYVVFSEELENAPKDPIRAFASVTDPNSGAPTYQSTLEAMKSPTLRASILSQAREELQGWTRRYRSYQELGDAVDAVGKALDVLNTSVETTLQLDAQIPAGV